MSVEASAAWPKNQRGFKLRKNSVADFGSAIPLQSSIENAGMQKHIFNNSQLALRVMEAVRWPSGVTCIYCGCKVVSAHGRDKLHYRCARCAKLFDFSTGTVLADTDLLPQDLLLALYTFCTSKYRSYRGYKKLSDGFSRLKCPRRLVGSRVSEKRNC
jgi:DNA-directed RNA polymerase subunit RPC12/RpoP